MELSKEERENSKNCYCAKIKCPACYNWKKGGYKRCAFATQICINSIGNLK